MYDAVDGRPDIAIYGQEVTESGRVEMLPFLREQAISITAHRFGTPHRLAYDFGDLGPSAVGRRAGGRSLGGRLGGVDGLGQPGAAALGTPVDWRRVVLIRRRALDDSDIGTSRLALPRPNGGMLP